MGNRTGNFPILNEERELHKKYAEKHVRGEWYSLTPEDLDEIRSNHGIRD